MRCASATVHDCYGAFRPGVRRGSGRWVRSAGDPRLPGWGAPERTRPIGQRTGERLRKDIPQGEKSSIVLRDAVEPLERPRDTPDRCVTPTVFVDVRGVVDQTGEIERVLAVRRRERICNRATQGLCPAQVEKISGEFVDEYNAAGGIAMERGYSQSIIRWIILGTNHWPKLLSWQPGPAKERHRYFFHCLSMYG